MFWWESGLLPASRNHVTTFCRSFVHYACVRSSSAIVHFIRNSWLYFVCYAWSAQTSPKRWFGKNEYDVKLWPQKQRTPNTMTTLRHWMNPSHENFLRTPLTMHHVVDNDFLSQTRAPNTNQNSLQSNNISWHSKYCYYAALGNISIVRLFLHSQKQRLIFA